MRYFRIEGYVMYVKAFEDDTIPDTETLSLTYLPDRVHLPTMTADPAKPNQYLPTVFCSISLSVLHIKFSKVY